MKKEKVCIWVFQLVRPSNSQNREKNVRFRETYPRVILHSSFEMSIDDVIGMTHRKKKLEKKFIKYRKNLVLIKESKKFMTIASTVLMREKE